MPKQIQGGTKSGFKSPFNFKRGFQNAGQNSGGLGLLLADIPWEQRDVTNYLKDSRRTVRMA